MKLAMIGQKGMPAIYGGVEKHVHELAVHLVKAGHDVTVYGRSWYTGGHDKTVEGVDIIHTPSVHTKHFDAITHTFSATIHALLKGFDVIHYHGVGPALLSWIPRLVSPKTRVITTFHSIDRYHKKWNRIARFFLRMGEWAACRFAHETVTISQSLKQYCLNEFDTETSYVPHGISHAPTLSSENPLNQFGLEKDKYFVMISRLVPHKGAHLLIEAFGDLKETCDDDPEVRELKLVIVGGSAYTNDYVQALHEQANSVNDIIFTDFQSGETLEALYAHAKALVHPSMNEGLPLTVIEAMNYRTPVLVSNIPEHLELIQDTRAVFTENSVEALEQKLVDFLRLSDEEKQTMLRDNLAIIDATYRWDVVIPQMEAVYRKANKNKTINQKQIVVA